MDILIKACNVNNYLKLSKISKILDLLIQLTHLQKAQAIKSQIKSVISPLHDQNLPGNLDFLIKTLIHKIHEKCVSFRQGFSLFDQNHDGKIYPQEFARAIQLLGLTITHQDIATLFSYLDQQKKGHLNYLDFSRLLGEQIETLPSIKKQLPKLFREPPEHSSKPTENLSPKQQFQHENSLASKKRQPKNNWFAFQAQNTPLIRRFKQKRI